MARLPTFVAALAVALLFAACPAAHAQLFKCVQDGKTVYQQEKCPETAKQSRIREPDSAPEKVLEPKAAAEKAANQAVAETDGLVDVISGFSLCSEKVANFGSKYADAYEDWKLRNVDAIQRFGSSPDGPRKLDARLQAGRAKSSTEAAADCARIVAAIVPRGAK
jgi:hypothetical protein